MLNINLSPNRFCNAALQNDAVYKSSFFLNDLTLLYDGDQLQ